MLLITTATSIYHIIKLFFFEVAIFTILQSFENSLKDLEPMESLRKNIQDKNHSMRAIGQKMDEIHSRQMDIKNESEQYQDTIR